MDTTFSDMVRRYMTCKRIVVGLGILFTGVVLTLLIPAIRYTDVLEPRVSDIDPGIIAPLIAENPDKYLFIDVRPPEMYAKLHAEGSINIPIHLFYDKRKDEFPKNTDKTIVLICSGGRLSGVAYSYLQHYGFRNIVRVGGGIENWQAQGYKTVLGDLN